MNTTPAPDSPRFKLWSYFHDEHKLTLVETELSDIVHEVEKYQRAIPAPVPPAQPTDLNKMVEAAAREIDRAYDIPEERPDDERYEPDESAIAETTAILLRHLQPLAEQVALEKQRADRYQARWEKECEQHYSVTKQLTAAQEELAKTAKDRDEWKAISLRLDAKVLHEQQDHNKTVDRLIALQSAHAKGAEDGKRLDWLEANKQSGGGVFRLQWSLRDDHNQANLRAAIDAARAKPEGAS